jgi:deoxyribodipyrimidine photo-lyase
MRGFPWRDDAAGLLAWQQARTGYPLVDAGLTELRRTGWMHGRVRLVVASFLTKHLLVDWRAGQDWFWDQLVDADLASNAMNWQWAAGSGTDTTGFGRIFNPIRQGATRDPEGRYVRRWLPALKDVPVALVHEPHKTAVADYPAPVVDVVETRRRAFAVAREYLAR